VTTITPGWALLPQKLDAEDVDLATVLDLKKKRRDDEQANEAADRHDDQDDEDEIHRRRSNRG
jgi:hypothetical protein